MKFLMLIPFLLLGCANQKVAKKLTTKEIEAKRIYALESVRPLMNSDLFDQMSCKELKRVELGKLTQKLKGYGETLKLSMLRDEAVKVKANIFDLSQFEKNGETHYSAALYKCKFVEDVKEVEKAGMCKASKSKILRIKFQLKDSRKVGMAILKEQARYYAINNYYKSFSVDQIDYSITRKEYTAHASFFKCL